MRALATATASLFVLSLAGPAPAQVDTASFEEENLALERAPPELTPDLLEPSARSRFHLAFRAGGAGPEGSFNGPLTWSLVPKGWVSLLRGFALGAAVPLGFSEQAGEDGFFLGNVRISATGGGSIGLSSKDRGDLGPRLHMAGALDIYAPTLTPPSSGCDRLSVCAGPGRVRRLHGSELELFLPDAFLARPRLHLAFSYRGFRIASELGISAGAYVGGAYEGEGLAVLGVAGRTSYDIVGRVEPYIEIASQVSLTHPVTSNLVPGRFDPEALPVLLTAGVRVYADELAPALFATLDVDQGIVFLGVDFAGVLRATGQRRETDFFDRDRFDPGT